MINEDEGFDAMQFSASLVATQVAHLTLSFAEQLRRYVRNKNVLVWSYKNELWIFSWYWSITIRKSY